VRRGYKRTKKIVCQSSFETPAFQDELGSRGVALRESPEVAVEDDGEERT
jgi:hypothetical protein